MIYFKWKCIHCGAVPSKEIRWHQKNYCTKCWNRYMVEYDDKNFKNPFTSKKLLGVIL